MLGALVACDGPAPVARHAPFVLRVPLPRDILTLDPAQADEITTFNVVRQLYEGLVDYDPATLEVVPRLARSWTRSADGLEWRFELQAGVRFADDACFGPRRSREATAADAKFSLERCLGQGRGGRDAELPPLDGLGAYLSGSAPEISGIVVEGDRTLRLELRRPDATLLHFLARPCGRIVAREAVETYGEAIARHAVGTGPFRLVAWHPLAGILLVRNGAYWQRDADGARLPYVDALRFVPAPHASQMQLYARGELELAYNRAVDPGTGGEPRGEQRFLVALLNTIYVGFDHRSSHPAVRDRRLRHALALVAPHPGSTLQRPARGLFPPGLPGFDPDLAGQRVDPAEAERLLGAAGHPRGRGLRPLRLVWREWDLGVGRRVADALRGLGLEVDLLPRDDRAFAQAVAAGEADLFRGGWVADYPDPQTFLELFYSGSPQNLGSYSDSEFDALFVAFRAEVDAATRTAMARRLERLLLDDAAAIFLHHEQESRLVRGRVRNWEHNGTNPLNLVFFERVRLQPGDA